MAAQSQRGNRRKAPKLYSHGFERTRVQIDVGSETPTCQSFRDSCDVNNIIDLHARTGILQHRNRAEPQYGETPDADLFDAACVQAELRSAAEEGNEIASDALRGVLRDDLEKEEVEATSDTPEAVEASETPEASSDDES